MKLRMQPLESIVLVSMARMHCLSRRDLVLRNWVVGVVIPAVRLVELGQIDGGKEG